MIREATEADAGPVAELLLRSPQAGRLLLGQDRRHDFFARRRGFADAATFVIDGDAGPEATITVARKALTVGEEPVIAGYVFDLAVDEQSRGRGVATGLLVAAHDWSEQTGAHVLYANIMGGNQASAAVFERAGYDVRFEMRLRIFPVFRGRPVHNPSPIDWGLAAQHLGDHAASHDLAPTVTPELLEARWRGLPGWRDDDLWVTERAILGLWDHRAVSRPIPLRLPVELRALNVVSRIAERLGVAFPGPVEVGHEESIGYVLGGAGDNVAVQRLLLAALGRAHERGLDSVAVAYQAGRRPAWARGAFSIGERYDIVARPLRDSIRRTLGDRPVWADPIDL